MPTTKDAELPILPLWLEKEAGVVDLRNQIRQLRAAAERVVWFDWSNNDSDAVAAVDDLRKIVMASLG